MELDGDFEADSTPVLKGFRRRWKVRDPGEDEAPAGDESEPPRIDPNLECDSEILDDDHLQPFGDDLDFVDWDLIEPTVDATEDEIPANSLKRPFDLDAESFVQPGPQVLDPLNSEPFWRAQALHAEVKKAKTNSAKLPWELEGSVFKSRDPWQGTVVYLHSIRCSCRLLLDLAMS